MGHLAFIKVGVRTTPLSPLVISPVADMTEEVIAPRGPLWLGKPAMVSNLEGPQESLKMRFPKRLFAFGFPLKPTKMCSINKGTPMSSYLLHYRPLE